MGALTYLRALDLTRVALERAGVPYGPINDLQQVFDDPPVITRGLRVGLPHPSDGTAMRGLPHPSDGTTMRVANPVKMSATPPQARLAPLTLGQHTDEVLAEWLGDNAATLAALREQRVI
ncbi:CoA transferase [Mycetohabitans sp. B8]|uniref:CoA transferase n=1 Tax=Mycetohabitans sp. B8 TaxID=2841845 RepID=UPI001F011434|nr:CoA transferase [Mycetohabitans sp. B8]